MVEKPSITAELVRQLLDYDPSTGRLVWRERQEYLFCDRPHCIMWNKKFANKEAGTFKDGYRMVVICNKQHRAHRVIWLHYYGEWPESDVDHINMDRGYNRISNLRLATRSDNMANTAAHRDSLSGAKGVTFDKRRRTWIARIYVRGASLHLGTYRSRDEAAEAYRIAAQHNFGTFARFK